ncbi:MAG: hypothetical protein HXY34_06255 [Candidatus Thorarchaeota archaeon]|nr:hypothetical protein [Candidatus Thorarchaeota archaeon]
MAESALSMHYEFFSWKGFMVGATMIALLLIVQSWLGFPAVWSQRAIDYVLFIVVSAVVVGTASGSVLVYLIPPDQDVIGVSGLGSDAGAQHVSLVLVLLGLLQPMMTGFVYFFEYFGNDPLIVVWVVLSFAAPSAGLAEAMYDRQAAIAQDLRAYFSHHDRLDLVRLDWLHGHGPRNAVYRMGMLESAAKKVKYLKVVGHEIVRDKDTIPVTQ